MQTIRLGHCNVWQYCPTCITKLELGPKRTQESPIATLNEEEGSEADRALNLDHKSKVDGQLDSNAWIFDNQNKRVHHPDIPHQPPVFPVERPLSMEDYSWLANLERLMHERIWEHWGWDKTVWETSETPSANQNDENESKQERVERIHVPWKTKPSEDQLRNYYHVRCALLMANTEFWITLFKMDKTLFLYYFPYKEEDDRHPTENILWERLKPAIKHLDLEDLATDPDCKICSRPLKEREELEAREPYETTFHNSGWNDSPIMLPCKHVVGYHCLWRKIHDWDWNACKDRVENPGSLIVCPVCKQELNVVGDKVLFEDCEERRWLDELDPLLVEDSTILAEINKNTSPWWLEILRGQE